MSSDGSNETPQNETPLNQHYTNLHEQCGDILSRSFAHDENNSLPNAHNYISDLEDWLSILSGRTECPLIKRGLREYQFSIFLLTKGNYRHAFMALRLHLEITLNAIYLSGYEKHLRDWKSGHIDTK